MSHQIKKSDMLLSHGKELVKQYVQYDGQSRLSKVYTARTDAPNGEPCMVTEYIYTSNISTTLLATKEGHSTWNSAWDADFTVSVET